MAAIVERLESALSHMPAPPGPAAAGAGAASAVAAAGGAGAGTGAGAAAVPAATAAAWEDNVETFTEHDKNSIASRGQAVAPAPVPAPSAAPAPPPAANVKNTRPAGSPPNSTEMHRMSTEQLIRVLDEWSEDASTMQVTCNTLFDHVYQKSQNHSVVLAAGGVPLLLNILVRHIDATYSAQAAWYVSRSTFAAFALCFCSSGGSGEHAL